MRVLIAEDDALVRRVLQLTVQRLGHECSVAEDGLAAWERYQAERPDVLITDWMMPGLDGVELCRRIRAESGSGYCYLILLTAMGAHEHALTAIRAGADDHLTKPLDAAALEVRLLAASRVTALHARLAQHEVELQHSNRTLAAEARRDSLTQLGNRLCLDEDLAAIESKSARYGYGYGYCVAMCDLDRFKALNDGQGHQVGDRVLRAVADTLVRGIRQGDSLYRYGGEELLLLLPEQSLETAFTLCERLRRAVSDLGLSHPGNPPSGVVTVSFGTAAHEGGPAGHRDVLRRADLALYEAKSQGRDRVCADPAHQYTADRA